jgi:hypothetical protein
LQTTQKNLRILSVQPGHRGSNDLRVGRKMATIQLFFQFREQMVFRLGQIRRIGWGIKSLVAPEDQFLLGCKCPVSMGVVVQEQEILGYLPAAFFLQTALQLHQQRLEILRVDSLALWKIISAEDVVLVPKSRREIFQQIFALGIFLGGVSRHSIDCCFASES